MITLITGLPGNGKTLYALYTIKAYAEKENREVFYSGIKDLLLPWTEIKAEEWMTCPAGSIIVIDEGQFTFPKKPNGSKLPEHFEKLAVHRHSGFDIFIITQHPSLLDNFVRMLAGRHLHLIRKFGMQRANVWEWAAANMTPEKASSHKGAVLHKFSYPKEVYGYYKSAEVHTVKRAIPMKLILACAFVLAVPSFGYYVLDRFQKKTVVQRSENGQVASVSPVSSGGKVSYVDAVSDAKQYVFIQTPRVDGLPHTAPRFDELTRPTRVPVPAACIVMPSRNRCLCYSQQATPLHVSQSMCIEFARNGFFEEFDPNGSREERSARSAAVLDRQERLAISGASTRDVPVSSQVLSLGDPGQSRAVVPGASRDVLHVDGVVASALPQARVPVSSPWRAP